MSSDEGEQWNEEQERVQRVGRNWGGKYKNSTTQLHEDVIVRMTEKERNKDNWKVIKLEHQKQMIG